MTRKLSSTKDWPGYTGRGAPVSFLVGTKGLDAVTPLFWATSAACALFGGGSRSLNRHRPENDTTDRRLGGLLRRGAEIDARRPTLEAFTTVHFGPADHHKC